jgi:glycerol uptake facilitator protein
MSPPLAEFLGTALLILLGNGVVAGVLLDKTKGHGSGWIVITAGWAMAVFVAVFSVARVSGAHLNPAVSLAMAMEGHLPWSQFGPYVVAQMLGALAGSFLVWIAYLPHWKITPDAELKRACFCTAPAIRNAPANLACEVIGTFVLIFGVFCMKGASGSPEGASIFPIDLGALGALPVGLLVFAIGLSLGGPTGYAINPARDLAPRIAHAILPIAGKGGGDWSYAWIPVAGPLLGAALAALAYSYLGDF